MPEFLDVQEVLNTLDLKESMSGAEFGCGSALFAMALAKKLAKGRVYAIDVQEEKLLALKGRLAHEHMSNVMAIHSNVEAPGGSTLKDNQLDIVLIPNVLFQAGHQQEMVQEGARILKPGGQLLVIDWLKEGPFSPKEGMITPDHVKAMAKTLGLALKKELAVGDYHFALLFTK